MLGLFIISGIILLSGIIGLTITVKKKKETLLALIFVLITFVGLALASLGSVTHIRTANEVLYREEQRALVVRELRRESTDVAEQKMFEYNEWLLRAKLDKQTHGIFSRYYFINLNALEFIDRGNLRG